MAAVGNIEARAIRVPHECNHGWLNSRARKTVHRNTMFHRDLLGALCLVMGIDTLDSERGRDLLHYHPNRP
jgi:hypothetical protein